MEQPGSGGGISRNWLGVLKRARVSKQLIIKCSVGYKHIESKSKLGVGTTGKEDSGFTIV